MITETTTYGMFEGFEILRHVVKKDNKLSSTGKSYAKNGARTRTEIHWGLRFEGEPVGLPLQATRRLKDVKRCITRHPEFLLSRNRYNEAIKAKLNSLSK